MNDEDRDGGQPSTSVDEPPAPPTGDAADPGGAAESEADAPAADPVAAEATDVGARIEAGVERILTVFEDKLQYDAHKQQVIDRLHEELQGHRADLVEQAARPFIVGMVRHHAEIGKVLTAVRDAPAGEVSPAQFCELLEGLQDDVEIVLSDNGVSAYRAEVSDPFDAARHTVRKTVPTDDGTRARTVASCTRPGFERNGRVLVKARVSTYRFEPEPPTA